MTIFVLKVTELDLNMTIFVHDKTFQRQMSFALIYFSLHCTVLQCKQLDTTLLHLNAVNNTTVHSTVLYIMESTVTLDYSAPHSKLGTMELLVYNRQSRQC